VTALAGLAAPAPQWIEVLEGRAQFEAAADEIEQFSKEYGAPVTARTAWTRASLDAVPNADPLAVLVRDQHGLLRATALLLVMTGPGADMVVSPGGLDHRAAIPAADAWAAAALGEALADAIARRPRPALVRLGPLPINSPALAAVASALRGAATISVDPIPVVRRCESAQIDDYLAHGIRRGLRRGRNRLSTDGRSADVGFTSDRAEVLRLTSSMERTSRERDHAHGRTSPLDDPTGRALWKGRLQNLASAGDLELATLQLDGRMAAYVLGVLDGRTYRVLEGRFVSEYARYSPGRLLEAAVLQRVLDDARLDTLDWMTAVAPETLLAANDSDASVVVQAEVHSRVQRDAHRRGAARRLSPVSTAAYAG
jgi:CelD/BcsL family acetyltransferase involved in cellulose biosynthesis